MPGRRTAHRVEPRQASRDWTVKNLAAVVQHHDPVAMLECERDVVHHQDEGLVPACEQLEDGGPLHPIERRDRLVSKQNGSAVVDGPRNRRPLLLPAREFTGTREHLVGKTDLPQHIRDLGNIGGIGPDQRSQVRERGPPVEPAHVDVVKHRQSLDQCGRLGDQRDLVAALRVKMVQQRGFAGAAASHESHAFAGCDPQIDRVEHAPVAVVRRSRPEIEHGQMRQTSPGAAMSARMVRRQLSRPVSLPTSSMAL